MFFVLEILDVTSDKITLKNKWKKNAKLEFNMGNLFS